MGQHYLLRGKQTAFDTDIRVPLVIAGPGVPAGKVVAQVTQNTDLYPTFAQLTGGTPGNVAQTLTARQKTELQSILAKLESCHNATACWGAGLPR